MSEQTRRDALAEALAAHPEYYDGDCGYYTGCGCGWNNGTDEHNDGYEQHQADALLPLIATWEAEAEQRGRESVGGSWAHYEAGTEGEA